MNRARWFSTSFRRSAQPLFEDFVRPLNNEQKKVIRKVQLKKEPNLSNYLGRDIQHYLKKYQSQPVRVKARRRLHEQLRQIVRTHFGDGYDVDDVSSHVYANDLCFAPFEFAIVDLKRPSGLSAEDISHITCVDTESPMPLPEAYNPSSVAKVLQAEGFDGVFEDQLGPAGLPKLDRSTDLSRWNVRNMPWPEYRSQRSVYREILYPVKLEARSPEPFTLMTASPVTPLLVRLIKAYVNGIGGIKSTIGCIHLFAKSLEIPGLNPILLALMTIRVAQVLKGPILNLQNPTVGVLSSIFQVTYPPSTKHPVVSMPQIYLDGGTPRLAIYETDAAFINPPSVTSFRSPGKLIYEFMKYWSLHLQDRQCRVESIRTAQAHLWPRAPSRSNRSNNRSYAPLGPGDQDKPCDTWNSRKLVIQDPFNFTHNHAAGLNGAAFSEFQGRVGHAMKLLRKGHSLRSILGDRLPSIPDEYSIPVASSASSEEANAARHGPPSAEGSTRFYSSKTSAQFQSLRTFGRRTQGFHTSAVCMREVPPSVINLSAASPEVVEARRATVYRVQRAIRTAFSGKYIVKTFGSTFYGIDSETSDLDLVICDPDHPRGWAYGIVPPKKNLADIYNLKLIAKALKSQFSNITVVPAKVPIVKFLDRKTGIWCDLNVNERLGYLNSQLIREYCVLSPLLRDVVIAIKRWAKPQGFNNPAGHRASCTFSSYALVMMTIALFQHWGILPNLQEGFPPLRPESKEVFWTPIKKKAKSHDWIRCDVRFKRNLEGWQPRIEMSFEEALLGWFRYYGCEHLYQEDLVSIRHGGIVPRLQPVEIDDLAEEEPEEIEQSLDEAGVDVFMKFRISKSESSPHAEFNNVIEQREVDDSDSNPDIEHRDNDLPHLDVEVESEGETDISGAEEFDLPRKAQSVVLWPGRLMAIADPFIIPKNLASPVQNKDLYRFQDECRRVVELLQAGYPFEEVIAPEKPKEKTKRRVHTKPEKRRVAQSCQ